MFKVDPALSTVTMGGALAVGVSVLLYLTQPSVAQHMATLAATPAQAADAPPPKPVWAASATGRVEPKDGELRLDTQLSGKIVEVLAKTNDAVTAGDLLVRIDDADLMSKVISAESEVLVRVREREEEPPAKGPQADFRKAEDALAAAERARFKARQALDDAYRSYRAGKSSADDVTAARTRLQEAIDKVASEQVALEKVVAKGDVPLPTRLETAVTQSRADLLQLELAVERTRVRAPSNGTVLNVWAKVGELAETAPETALVLFGDLASLRVRAEVEERDVVNIRIGQKVVIRADAYPGRDFEGVVSSLAPALGPPRILSRGPRRPNDVEVLEVLADLDGNPPLLTGMRVDTFFRAETSASNEAAPKN